MVPAGSGAILVPRRLRDVGGGSARPRRHGRVVRSSDPRHPGIGRPSPAGASRRTDGQPAKLLDLRLSRPGAAHQAMRRAGPVVSAAGRSGAGNDSPELGGGGPSSGLQHLRAALSPLTVGWSPVRWSLIRRGSPGSPWSGRNLRWRLLTATQFAYDGVSDRADVAFHVVRVFGVLIRAMAPSHESSLTPTGHRPQRRAAAPLPLLDASHLRCGSACPRTDPPARTSRPWANPRRCARGSGQRNQVESGTPGQRG